MQYINLTDTTETAITVVSEGNEFMVCTQGDFDSGNVQVQYDRGDGTFATFGSGTITTAGELVFLAPGKPLQVVASGAAPDIHILVTELKFEQ